MNINDTVRVIDTIYNKVVVFDTIYQKTTINISDTIQPDLVKVYEKVIETQQANFNNILMKIGITVSALLVLFAVIDVFVLRGMFKKIAKKQAKERIDKATKRLREDYKKEIKRQENISRGISRFYTATTISIMRNNKFNVSVVELMFSALDDLSIALAYDDIKKCLNNTLIALNKANNKTLLFKNDEFDINEHIETLNNLPGKIYKECSEQILEIRQKLNELNEKIESLKLEKVE